MASLSRRPHRSDTDESFRYTRGGGRDALRPKGRETAGRLVRGSAGGARSASGDAKHPWEISYRHLVMTRIVASVECGEGHTGSAAAFAELPRVDRRGAPLSSRAQRGFSGHAQCVPGEGNNSRRFARFGPSGSCLGVGSFIQARVGSRVGDRVNVARTTTDESAGARHDDVPEPAAYTPSLGRVSPNEADATADEPALGGGKNVADQSASTNWQSISPRGIRLHYKPPNRGRSSNRGHQRSSRVSTRASSRCVDHYIGDVVENLRATGSGRKAPPPSPNVLQRVALPSCMAGARTEPASNGGPWPLGALTATRRASARTIITRSAGCAERSSTLAASSVSCLARGRQGAPISRSRSPRSRRRICAPPAKQRPIPTRKGAPYDR